MFKYVEINSTSSKAVTINGGACENIDLTTSNLSNKTTMGDKVSKKAV
ncbi:hypothetical protein [Flavobacterium nitratireducens]|nr:hypothetical protein [Flavobacterium nitratireducens]